jgi:hypothetical protein
LKDQETEHTSLTRRVVLTGGLGCALTLLISQQVLGAKNRSEYADTRSTEASADGELYVFRGSAPDTTVIAATWTAMYDHQSTLIVHAGGQNWTLGVPDRFASAAFADDRGCQLFAGDILNRRVGHGARLKAVVIEAPTHTVSAGGSVPVWAERISQQGHRLRIGSPFMSKLAAGNLPAARLYHASSPAQDGEEITRLVAEAISINAEASGYRGNARLYGRRVASAITPDALRFDPHLPVGFTFAAQNGRHPDDAAQSVVDTVLNGTLAPEVSRPNLPLAGQFPYFPQPRISACRQSLTTLSSQEELHVASL